MLMRKGVRGGLWIDLGGVLPSLRLASAILLPDQRGLGVPCGKISGDLRAALEGMRPRPPSLFSVSAEPLFDRVTPRLADQLRLG
jgi:hypothetical protein